MPGSILLFAMGKDGEAGKVGYEINFNRYFYKYQPPPAAGGNRNRYQDAGEGNPGDVEGRGGMRKSFGVP
jgi:hypothetical protein